MLLDTTTKTFLAGRPGIRARWLFWISARSRLTGEIETTGLWTGDDDAQFTIGSETRAYFGAGGLIDIAAITYRPGLNVQMQSVTLAIMTPEVEQAIRTYDPRLAPAEIHMALFHPETDSLVSITRAYKGFINGAPIREGGGFGNETAVCEIELASSARAGTRTLPLKKSDAAQRQRNAADKGRQYVDVSGSVQVWWGEIGSNGPGGGGGGGRSGTGSDPQGG